MFNLDFSKTLAITPTQQAWEASPAEGVSRKRFAYDEIERGHATSLVRFDAGCSFGEHDHPGGEEIFVLEGVFSDQNGDHPAGSYLRNPEGYRHAPFSQSGCVIFVKLHQFQQDDRARVVIDTNTQPWLAGHGGLQVMPLHAHGAENTALVKWPSAEEFQPHQHWGGEEIYVISGEFIDEHGRYPAGSWLRSPHLSAHNPFVEVETLILVKTGHLVD